METTIIAGFPGTGKSFQHQNNPQTTSDSDSSEFSWEKDEFGKNTKIRNPQFPDNYMDHIEDNIGLVDVIFVSSHAVVREALQEHGYNFTLVYPDISLKEEYLERFKKRGSPEGFINLLSTNWETWINECENEKGCTKICLNKGQYISDVI
jgi:hypothetical protein